MSVNTYNSTTGVLTRVAGNGGGSFIYPHISITAETGSTVTITDGTATITAIETSEGLFEADVIDLKTYTIIATLDGATLTQTLDVDTVKKYSVDMGSNVPEGSTVTPTDDIQIWLACAEITDKNYTTLAEVLADTDTYQLLLSNSNACDYMARSTTWALAEGAVPTMTSNTTPSGEVSGTMVVNNQDWWQAFDGDDTTMSTGDGTISTTILGALQYHFASPVTINKIDTLIYTYAGGSGSQAKPASNFKQKFYASEDGTNWDLLYEDTTSQNLSTKRTLTCDISNKSYSYLKVDLLLDNLCWGIRAYTIQAYTADITTNETAMKYLGKYDYACEKLLGNATWAEAIANSDYFEYVLNTKVPKLSADSSSVITNLTVKATGYEKWHAFDGNTGGNFFYFQYTTSRTDGWVGYDFGAPVIIRKVSMFNISNTASIKQCKYQYSDDGTTWTDATELITNSLTGAWTDALIPSSIGAHRYWCAGNLDNNGDGGGAYIPELQFYGRKPLQDTVIVHSAPLDTIYYKINNLPVVVCTTNSDGIGEFDLDILDDGTYTLYSSVAKDPSNLSNDYSKEMRITKSQYGGTTELYFMPDAVKTLYWWGYESSNLEDLSSANGWSVSYSNISLSLGSVPTHNTNSIRIATTTSTISGVGTKNKILTTKMNILFTPITTTGAARIEVVQLKTSKYVTNQSDKYYYSTGNTTAAVNTMTLLDMNTSENDTYFEIDTWYGTVTDIHAIWYE